MAVYMATSSGQNATVVVKRYGVNILNKSSAVAETGDCATAEWAEKWRLLCPFLRGAGSPSNTVSPGRVLPPYQVVYASIQPFGHNRPGPRFINTQAFRLACVPKLRKWGCCAAFRGVAGSPSNTMGPGPKPTSIPSGIFIRSTVWLQYTHVTDRQTDRSAAP